MTSPPPSNIIKVEDLQAEQIVEENLFIQNFILYEKGMEVEEEDIKLLNKWKIEKLNAKSYFQSEKKFSLYFREQIKEYRNFTRIFTNTLKEFYEMTRLDYNITLPDYNEHFKKILSFYQNPSNFFSFYVNTEVPSTTYQSVALLTAFYSIMIGANMNLEEKELKKLFYASIFADIGFQQKSEKNILNRSYKKDTKVGEFSLEDNHYLDFHVKLSCDILRKKLKAPNDLIYLVLTQHAHLDKTGYPVLAPEKFSKMARVFSLAHNFVYLITDFLKPFREPAMMSHAIQILLKHKDRYDEQALNSLLTTVSFFPPGEVLLLSNQKIAVSVKANYRDPQRPIVEVISQPKRIGVSKTETINLMEESIDIVALINKQTVRQKAIRNLYDKF